MGNLFRRKQTIHEDKHSNDITNHRNFLKKGYAPHLFLCLFNDGVRTFLSITTNNAEEKTSLGLFSEIMFATDNLLTKLHHFFLSVLLLLGLFKALSQNQKPHEKTKITTLLQRTFLQIYQQCNDIQNSITATCNKIRYISTKHTHPTPNTHPYSHRTYTKSTIGTFHKKKNFIF